MIDFRVMKLGRYLTWVELSAMLLLLVYPIFMLTVKGGMNAIFLFMLLLALLTTLARPKGMGAVIWQHHWSAYVVAMFALPVALLVTQMVSQQYTAHPYDAVSRYFLAIPVFLLLYRLRPNVFLMLQFAFPLAAIAGLLMASDKGEGRLGVPSLDLIHSGDFELLLGTLSLFSLHWFKPDNLLIRTLKIAGFIAGVTASFASGSRGGWLAIPVFIVIFFYFKAAKISLRILFASLIAIMLSATLLFSLNSTVHQRVYELSNDIAMFNQGNRDTSAGLRWQLYKAALDVFLEHPVVGVGTEGFGQKIQSMVATGKITPYAAEVGRGEMHNDILSKAVAMGVLGLIAILAIYLVPLRLFWLARKSRSPSVRCSAMLGFTFVSGFIVFGLTVEILNLTMAVAFYSFTVAVLLAACYNTQLTTSLQPQ